VGSIPVSELWTLDQAHAWTVWRDPDSVDLVRPGQGPSGWTFRTLWGYRVRGYRPLEPPPLAIAKSHELDRACAAGELNALRLFANGTTKRVPAREWRDGTPNNPQQIRFLPSEVMANFARPEEVLASHDDAQCERQFEGLTSTRDLVAAPSSTSSTQPPSQCCESSEEPKPLSISECSVWDCAEALATAEAESFEEVLLAILWGIQQREIAVLLPVDIPSGIIRRQFGLMMHLIFVYETNKTPVPRGTDEFTLARRMTVNPAEVSAWWHQPAIERPSSLAAPKKAAPRAEPERASSRPARLVMAGTRDPERKKIGRRPIKREAVAKEMLAALESGKHTPDSLRGATEESLAAEFRASRTTIRRARADVLHEFPSI
jgi:hypothetical protein